MVKAYKSGDYTMKEITQYFSVHYSTESRAIQKYEILDCNTRPLSLLLQGW